MTRKEKRTAIQGVLSKASKDADPEILAESILQRLEREPDDDGGWSRQLPLGETMVELYRPPWHFGMALAVGRRGDMGTYLARPTKDGEVEWKLADPGIEYPPFLYLDDEIEQGIRRALNNQPQRLAGDAPYEHLQDAVAVRDRLLSLLEIGNTTMLQIVRTMTDSQTPELNCAPDPGMPKHEGRQY